MRLIKFLCAALLLMAYGCAPNASVAQSAVLQSGPVTAGHAPMYVNSGTSQPVLKDSGPASGGPTGIGMGEGLYMARGTGTPPYVGQGTGPFGTNWCDYDAPTNNPTGYHYLCMSPNAQGGGGLISYGAGGLAAPLPLSIKVNGSTVPTTTTGTGSLVLSNGPTINNATINGLTLPSLTGPLLGHGASPVTAGTLTGNTSILATSSGALVNGDCVSINGGNYVDAGAPCGGGSGGSGTVTSGTLGQLTYYAATGTVVSGNANATVSGGALTLGQSGTAGQLALSGATSGVVTLQAPSVAGSNSLTFPAGTTDFSSTGGTSQVVKQTASGGALSVGQLAATDLSNGTTGTGAVMLNNAPSLVSPLTLANGGTNGSTAPTARQNLIVPTYAATRSAMAGLSGSSDLVIWLQESGRQGMFQWSSTNHATDVTNDPNQCVFVPPTSASTGASGAWVRSYTDLFASYCGVVGDGTTNDTSAVNAAIAFDNYRGGGPLRFDNLTGVAVNATISVGNGSSTTRSTVNNITLVGKSPSTVFGPTAATYFKWIGSSGGGPVVKFRGPEQGGGLTGGWLIDCNSLAAGGLELDEMVGGNFPNLKVQKCSGVYTKLYADATSGAVTLGGTRSNLFGVYQTDTVPSGGTGLLLDAASNAFADTLQNYFSDVDISMSGTGAIGIQLGFADFNYFAIVDVGRQSTLTTSVGLKLVGGGPSGNNSFPELNTFGLLAVSGGIASTTSGGTPYGNFVETYDLADSDALLPTAVGVVGYVQQIYGASLNQTQVISFGFKPPGWNTATPTLPSGTGSTHKVTNTNTYPVQIYSSGGAGLDIIDSHGTDAGSIPPGTQGSYTVDSGGSVYFNTTVPASWIWYGLK